MSHAWLDSLSEDWVSQPGSDSSQLQLPSLSKPDNTRDSPSRIPRLNNAGIKKPQRPESATSEKSAAALSERSDSDINIPLSPQRAPSKSARDTRGSQRDRRASRSLSASTSGSILHNTLEQKSHSASPSKNLDDIPEWKRRLVFGYLSYGESKDLFSSAATGLENIFRPPVSPNLSTLQEDEDGEPEGIADSQMTMPSSPPPYSGAMGSRRIPQLANIPEQSVEDSTVQQPHAPASKQMKFRRTDDTCDSSRSDNSMTGKTGAFTNTGTQERPNSSFTSLSFKQRLEDASRKTSGESITKNEGLSPILISRHNSEDGGVNFAPIELPAQQLRKRLEHLRRNQMVLESDPDSDDVGLGVTAIADQSGNFENTEDFATKGGFLNLRRGGRSGDNSFRTRPLSPPVVAVTDTSEMLPESSIQASTPKQLPTIRTERFVSAENEFRPISPPSPALPRVPNPSPEKLIRPPQSSGGSPLKLFGPYDTFTNQTLLRRISQFEDQMTGGPSRSVKDNEPPSSDQPRREKSSSFNQFGAGELDGYEFSEDITLASNERSELEDKENLAPDSGRRPSDTVQFDIGRPLEEETLNIQRRRHKSRIAASPRQRRPTLKPLSELRHRNSFPYFRGRQATPKREGSEGKRPWTSPSKDPTPKRRRTLHRSDIAYGLEDGAGMIESVRNSHYNMQSAIARRWKGSQQDDVQQEIPPHVPVSRQISRSRSSTSSQKAASAQQRQPLADTGFGQGDDPAVGSSPEESEIRARDYGADGSRKTSMKTQDFFDAAEEIMAMIRNKARHKLSLDNVEESEAESPERRHSTESALTEEDSFQESTREPLSRPPSREGAPVPRAPNRQENPEIVDRLKKYEEVSELGGYVTYSLRQWKETDQSAPIFDESFQGRLHNNQLPHIVPDPDESEVISDLSNVRISRNPDAPEATQNAPEFPSNGSGGSTGHTIPTTSSSRSDSRRLIAPDAVTELIGDQVGNMVFDKEKKIWVKVKTPKPTPSGRNILPSEDSEDDPFASIPDLSVDTVKETAHLGFAPKSRLQNIAETSHEDGTSGSSQGPNISEEEETDSRSILSHTKDTFARIQQTLVDTAVEDDEEIEHEITMHEDRVHETSASRRKNLTISFSSPIASIIHDMTHQTNGDVSDESILQDQSLDDSIIADSYTRGRHGTSRRPVNGRPSRSRSRSRSKGATKNLSMKTEAFIPRPVSRIDEQDEDSMTEEVSSTGRRLGNKEESSMIGPDTTHEPQESLSVVLSTPAPARTAHLDATPLITQYVGTLSLSPLSDFTMNHGDQSCALEVSYVVGDQYLVTGGPPKKVMSNALRHLVEKITEVEPFEPDWNSMRELDISNKQMSTLHKLDEFCTNIVTLDASNNALGNLDGVPESVRNLRISHNQLSELTPWGHLMNLQYVDVSNNQLSSLYAFKDLVHLRSLRADNNQIASLAGINLHDSLQVLRVRNNCIESVDFDGTRLHRLTELDLEGNRIGAALHLEQLPCLATLNLQRNELTSFEPTTTSGQPIAMASMRYLKLSDNDLATLDLAAFPNLRLLHADRNQITTLTGFSRCRRLDTLSIREQQQRRGDGGDGDETTIAAPLDTSFLASAYEVRKLFLSGNNLSLNNGSDINDGATFALPVDYLNLQYLELANCGLRALAPGLGERMPNLRVLNLNCNALEDLSPLRYVPRLKKLLAAGNRLADARQFTCVLEGFPHLARLDARDNPATLGFYPPPLSSQQMQTLAANAEGSWEGEEGGQQQEQQQQQPFSLPDAPDGGDRDRRFQGRLDMGTRMRRRLYEVVVLGRCRRLRVLDGLPVDRSPGGSPLSKRDKVWEALVESGVVAPVIGTTTASTTTTTAVGDDSEEDARGKR
ncbi:Protein nud1 [Diatrype stigma]|uniref:Protein nud1 n=1 Tax=Diatrype stigma TaxID=117547 RepID=A0AAN9UXR3_9PEZI